jgi:hypothetical protein
MKIEFSYDSQIALSNSSISVGISHLHGTAIWGNSTEAQAIPVPIAIGSGRASLLISLLPLLDGTYDLSVAIADHAGIHEFDHWEKRIRFDVNQHGIQTVGLIDIQSTWHIES